MPPDRPAPDKCVAVRSHASALGLEYIQGHCFSYMLLYLEELQSYTKRDCTVVQTQTYAVAEHTLYSLAKKLQRTVRWCVCRSSITAAFAATAQAPFLLVLRLWHAHMMQCITTFSITRQNMLQEHTSNVIEPALAILLLCTTRRTAQHIERCRSYIVCLMAQDMFLLNRKAPKLITEATVPTGRH